MTTRPAAAYVSFAVKISPETKFVKVVIIFSIYKDLHHKYKY